MFDENEDEGPMFSPRNIARFLSRNISNLQRDSTPTNITPEQVHAQFGNYYQSFNKQYELYKRNRHRSEEGTNRDELEAQIKLSRIPSSYFSPGIKVESVKNQLEAIRKQEELEEYLDQVELVIFMKTSKYPSETFVYISNIISTQNQITKTISDVKETRSILKTKISTAAKKQKAIKKLQTHRTNIEKVLELMGSLKKLYALRKFAEADKIDKESLLAVDRKEMESMRSIKVNGIKRIVEEFEECEERIRENTFKVLKQELMEVISKSLFYNKEEWLASDIPDNAFNFTHEFVQQENGNHQQRETLNSSVMNISVLDQSYFSIQPTPDEMNLDNLLKSWKCFEQMSVNAEEEQELNQVVMREVVRNSVVFNRDFEDYVAYIFKIKKISVRQSLQTLKNFKHEDRLQILNIKFFHKLIRVYNSCLKNALTVLRKLKNYIPCFHEAETKLLQFIFQRSQYFAEVRKVNEKTSLQQLCELLNVVDFWINEDYLEEDLNTLRGKILEEYLLGIHKNILVNDLKKSIEQSSFTPISITSEYFMTFDFILSWGQKQDLEEFVPFQSNALEMSMSLYGEKPMNSIFRIIDKKIIMEGKEYKVCDSCLSLLLVVEKYLRVKITFPQMQKNADEKICQAIGFYLWYSKKTLLSSNNEKSTRSICLFVNVCEFMQKILDILNILTVPKKTQKLNIDVTNIKEQLKKQLTTVPLKAVESLVGKVYESRLKTRKEIPTPETMKMIAIIQQTRESFRSNFAEDETVMKYLQPAVKMISKNYFGYLMNLESRGKAEVKWLLPELKRVVGDMFSNEIRQMEREAWK